MSCAIVRFSTGGDRPCPPNLLRPSTTSKSSNTPICSPAQCAARCSPAWAPQVIKIESPNGGDPIRRHPPFADDDPHPEKSGSYLYLNTGKHSLTLDPATPTGADIFRHLVADADILIENHPPGFMASLGLGYDVP